MEHIPATSPEQQQLYALTSFSRHKKVPLLLIHLTEQDNDPAYFWNTFVSCLSQWNMEFASQQKLQGFPDTLFRTNNFLQSFTAELGKTPLLFLVNNLHCLRRNEVELFLHTLLQIQSRESSVALLYNTQQIVSGRESFSSDRPRYCAAEEEQSYYQQHLLELTPAQFSQIRSFTGGWTPAITGLTRRLILGQKDDILQNLDEHIRQWIQAEHYDVYPDAVRRSLLLLSLLDGFSLAMMQAGSSYSREELLEILAYSPFTRFDFQKDLFFFCSHYRKFLGERRGCLGDWERRSFYTSAGDWYRDHDDRIQAIQSYRKAGRYGRILETMLQWPDRFTPELAVCYIRTIEGMPKDMISSHPILQVIYAFTLCAQYRYEEAWQLMSEFCGRHDAGEATVPEIRPILGEAYFILTSANRVAGRPSAAYCRRATELLPEGSSLVHAKMQSYTNTYALHLGALDAYLRDLHETISVFSAPVWEGVYRGLDHLGIAELHFFRGDLAKVEAPARQAVLEALRWEQYDIVCSALFLLMRSFMIQGNLTELTNAFQELRRHAADATYSEFFTMPDLAESWLNLQLGRPQEVADWIRDEELALKLIPPRLVGRDRWVRTHYLLANQMFSELIPYLDTNIPLLKKHGATLICVELLLARAVALALTNQAESAARALEEVYAWTHPNRIVTIFLELSLATLYLLNSCRTVPDCTVPREWMDDLEEQVERYIQRRRRLQRQYKQSRAVSEGGST